LQLDRLQENSNQKKLKLLYQRKDLLW